jgi:hypothetical protein
MSLPLDAIMIAAGILALLFTPMLAYLVMWATGSKGDSGGDRPEPPQTNRPNRTIPGSDRRSD